MAVRMARVYSRYTYAWRGCQLKHRIGGEKYNIISPMLMSNAKYSYAQKSFSVTLSFNTIVRDPRWVQLKKPNSEYLVTP